ncbi:flagellar hook-basal body protein [Sporosarcina pasteurii]|uniref:Distal rod protein n=1 Tax=Sporosarcina pasteurii TaxID=1474 RepID=A0A380BEL7_SPOPA|nr:flagellar hook-basal body protein [Sporosarcina pasteurii]MDS9472260.1 flagellar hook-basal body protein [Sporosarcina pasteurii]QBQ06242.1 flagellar hook-basal body protein [Sporosarcina pasteurii]SUI99118.1 Distal rod protein [Sporosarcina pasteurii]
MIRTMITATNTMNQLQHQFDIIGNNLANASTHGFKASQASFQEMLYEQFTNDKADRAPRQSPVGIRYGTGAKIAQTQMNWKLGSLQATERQLDFALTTPKQYFNVIMPTEGGEETVYTRQGSFYITPIEGGQLMLVNDDGNPIANAQGMPIVFNDDVAHYSVQPGGILEVTGNNGTVTSIELGITVIERPNFMEHLSGTYIGLPRNMAELGVTEEEIFTNLQGADRNIIGLQNGVLETSNVHYEKEMTDLINVQRNYQFNARAVTLADQMLGLINGIR